MEQLIGHNLETIRQEMALACESAGRNVDEVKLVLATKTVPVEKLRAAIQSGATIFGENRAQELVDKFPFMKQYDELEWHFIGHLQSNKVRDVIKYATLIHSVDRLSLGKELHLRLEREYKTMDILVQVNTSYEESKFGVAPEDAVQLVEQLSQFPTLNIKGLMTIGTWNATEEETRRCFRLLRRIRNEIAEKNLPNVSMDELSMGMSGDFKIAIEEGSTMIRVGSRVFGERL